VSDVGELIQDLRAEAHRVPADIAELMRRAARELERRDRPLINLLADAAVLPPPVPPPAIEHAAGGGTSSRGAR
jgi:hypothetical protein